MQTVLTIVFLAFIVGSLCNVVTSLLHPPRPTVRLRRGGVLKRSVMKQMKYAERQQWDIPIAM